MERIWGKTTCTVGDTVADDGWSGLQSVGKEEEGQGGKGSRN